MPVDWKKLLPWTLAAAGVAIYLNSLAAGFVFDDEPHILRDPSIRDLTDIPAVLAGELGRPLLKLTLAVNYAIDGFEPRGYHLLNMLVHIGAGLAMYGVIRRTLLRSRWSGVLCRPAPWIAFAVALLWLVHPLNTQAVTYVIQRGESMMGLFCLLTLYCAIRAIDAPRGLVWQGLAVLSCGLGMASKQVMVTTPLLVMLYDRVFLTAPGQGAARSRKGFYGLLCATWIVLIVAGSVWRSFEKGTSAGFGFEALTWYQYALTQPLVILNYLKLSIWPDPLVLDYMWRASHTFFEIDPPLLATLKIALPAAVMFVLLALTVWGVVRRNCFGYLGAWFFITLAPTSSVFPIADLMFEHRMYLPLAAVVTAAVAVVYLLGRCAPDAVFMRGLATVSLTLIVLVLGGLTIRRNLDYRSDLAIWESVVVQRPFNIRGWYNCGNAYYDESRKDVADQERMAWEDRALTCWHRVLRFLPSDDRAHNQIGTVWLAREEYERAIEHFRVALEQCPDEATYHYNLGNAFLGEGDEKAAEVSYERAIERDVDYAKAYNQLGTIQLRRGQLAQATALFWQAMAADEYLRDAYVNLGSLFISVNRPDEAITVYESGLRLFPDDEVILANAGIALAATRRYEDAERVLLRAIDRNPHYGKAYFRLGALYTAQRRDEAAVQMYEGALALRPDWVEAKRGLAWILATTRLDVLKQPGEALRLAQEVNETTGNNVMVYLDTLAAGQAASGQFDQAIVTVQRAIVIGGMTNGSEDYIEMLRRRQELYRRGEVYREP